MSPSMDYTFKSAKGKEISRVDYVKQQLSKTMFDQLRPTQNFNIVAFGSTQSFWNKDFVEANKSNV